MNVFYCSRALAVVLLVAVFLGGCSREQIEPVGQVSIPAQNFSKNNINKFITQKIEEEQKVFNWASTTDEMLYSALIQSDSILAIGYQIDGTTDIAKWIGTQEVLPQEWIEKRTEILEQILLNEQAATKDESLALKSLLPFTLDDKIPTIAIKVTSFATIQALRQNPNIRYVEPMGYSLEQIVRSDSGCGSSPNYNINTNDYTNSSSYNTKIPWVHYKHNIPNAWAHSNGNNIGICVIDTGGSDDQDNLNDDFDSGASGNRTVEKYSTKYSGAWWWKSLDAPHDQCGHGTSMSGLAAAPWGTDGNAVGVAYQANLVTVRAVEDVIISSSNEKEGVKNALKLAGDKSSVNIVSMSLGNVISSGTVEDGIYYAYNNEKLIFAAAGTSTSYTNWYGVIFPASMNETTAVTGIKDQNNYERCDVCHSGNKVDFTVIMERSNNTSRHSLALATTGDLPQYVGGSSCSTATMAGMAALVWATNPNMSRANVLDRLKTSSENYPNKNNNFGWGNVNAYGAVTNTGF